MDRYTLSRRRSFAKRTVTSFLAALLLSSCYSYEADPQDRWELLEELQKIVLPTLQSKPDSQLADGRARSEASWTSMQAASWAVSHNPALLAVRMQLGIAEAELVEAGLLPDPEFAFDAMNVVASEATGLEPIAADYISGLGLMWRVPRPGEISSKRGVAKARREEVRQGILEAEWTLVRAVHRAWIDVQAAEARLQLNTRVLETAKKVSDFFQAARKVRGATALQANLPAIEYATLRQNRVRLEGQLGLARQTLNALLGLQPSAVIPMRASKTPFASNDQSVDASALTKRALAQRPDLEALFARYQALEEALRLEVAKQWPELAIGSGLAFVLPIFSSFNAPAIRTAMSRRERMARKLKAAVHRLRAEVHAAVTVFESERRQVQAFKDELIPRIEENLRLAQQAFEAREVTLVEILTAQRQSLETQQNYLEARIRKAVARLMMDTASGAVLNEFARMDKSLGPSTDEPGKAAKEAVKKAPKKAPKKAKEEGR